MNLDEDSVAIFAVDVGSGALVQGLVAGRGVGDGELGEHDTADSGGSAGCTV